LASAWRRAVRHRPVEAHLSEQARDEAGRLARRKPDQNLHRQAGVDRSVALDGCAPRLPDGTACHDADLSHRTVDEPRARDAASWNDQFRMRERADAGVDMPTGSSPEPAM
jgi:hypothetical protein